MVALDRIMLTWDDGFKVVIEGCVWTEVDCVLKCESHSHHQVERWMMLPATLVRGEMVHSAMTTRLSILLAD